MTWDCRSGKATLRRLAGRLAAALLLTVGLSACAIPPAISIASMAADGVLLAATGKSKADHGLSLATGKDCSTFRVLDGEDVCQDVVVAQIEPLPAEVVRELDTLRVAARRAEPAGAASREQVAGAASREQVAGAASREQVARAASHLSGQVALAAAFRTPQAPTPMPAAVPPVVEVAAAPMPAVRVAALRPPPTGATPGRIKLDRPGPARAVVAAATTAKFAKPSAPSRRLAGLKAKRLAALKAKRVAALKAKVPDSAAVRVPLVAPMAASVPPSTSAPARLSRAGSALSDPQLALAIP